MNELIGDGPKDGGPPQAEKANSKSFATVFLKKRCAFPAKPFGITLRGWRRPVANTAQHRHDIRVDRFASSHHERFVAARAYQITLPIILIIIIIAGAVVSDTYVAVLAYDFDFFVNVHLLFVRN